ncbi:acyltransferase family protein, partial [Dactylosporangium sp. NPDC049525]|uniref:acyltransferase family protein n=1 Tax=Dactylosporangium sp. NPDC049525 TaxID=3154730 RepID=UPI0034277788
MDRNSRLPSLTGLRWAAALIVFGQHLLEQYYNPQLVAAKPVRSAVWAALAHGGGLGVSFFFVLSGFVLAWSARPGERAGTFWWRRFSKVYPATLITTLAAALLVGGAGPLQLATHLTLTQSWVPRHDVYAALNLVSWSLSCEVFFYLCFPLLLAGMRRLGPAGLWAIVVMMIECVAALAANLVSATHSTAAYIGYVLPPVRMAEFTLGVAVALLVRTGAWRGPGLRWSLALLPPTMFAGLFAPYPINEHALTLVPVTLVVAAAARADLLGRPTLWSRPLMVYLGELSFAFYLVHFLVLTGFDRYGLLPHRAGPAQALVATASVLWFSLIAAMVVYHGVEQPALRLLRSRGRSGRGEVVPAGWRGRHRMVLTAAPAPRFAATVPMPRPALPPAPPPIPVPRPTVPVPRPTVAARRLDIPVRRSDVPVRRLDIPVRRLDVPAPRQIAPASRRTDPVPRLDVPVPQHADPVPRPDVPLPVHADSAAPHADPVPLLDVPAPRHADPVPRLDVPVPQHADPVPRPDVPLPVHADSA